MRFFYFPKKTLLISGAIIILVILILGLGIGSRHIATNASGQDQPIFQGNTGSKAVALTVNVDWGEEYIPAMLDEFKKNNAPVTFFVTGQWVEKNPELLQQMAQAGHSIQNHGYKHCHFAALNQADTVAEIKKAEETINKITGQPTTFFAPPYGEYNTQLVKTVRDINYQYIMWSVDTIDWQRPTPDTIVKRVMKKVHNDAIILMHPTEPTVKALPDLLQQLQAQNYQMVTINVITSGATEGGNVSH